MPVELEYWRSRRSAFSVGIDYQARVRDGGELFDEGFGLTAGNRVRMK